VTRLAHSRADVQVGQARGPNVLDPSPDRSRWTLVPTNARPRYRELLAKQARLHAHAEQSPFNELHLTPDREALGVITAGVAYNYFREVVGEQVPSFLKVGLYPVPVNKVLALLEHVERVLILEDGYPFIEKQLLGSLELQRGQESRFLGRFTGHLPGDGELTPDLVGEALAPGLSSPSEVAAAEVPLRPRPPQLCKGCPHRDTFNALNMLRKNEPKARVFSDIGCYTLGYYPPFETITSCLDMGASIGMAKGASDAGLRPALCVIGDSTFGHSGITSLLTAAQEDTPMTVVIVDNSTVAMTGTQDSLTTGDKLFRLAEAVGVPKEHIRKLNPLPKHLDENARIIAEEAAHDGLSVIISQRPCLEIR